MSLSRAFARVFGRAPNASLDRRPADTSAPATRGPEIAPSVYAGDWSNNGGLTGTSQDSTGLHFNGSGAGALTHSIASEDNTTYEIIYTLSDYSTGTFSWQLYGATTAHLGQTTTRSANGTYTEQVTTSAAGSLALLLRAKTMTSAGNTYSITALSIKKVLA